LNKRFMKKIIFIQGFFVLLLLNGTLQKDFLGQPSQFSPLLVSPSSPELPKSPEFGRLADPNIGIPPTQISLTNSQESNPLSIQKDFSNARYEPEKNDENFKSLVGKVLLIIFGPPTVLYLLVVCSMVCFLILKCSCQLLSCLPCARPFAEPSLRCIENCIVCHSSCLKGIDKAVNCCCKETEPLLHAAHYAEAVQENVDLLLHQQAPQSNTVTLQNQPAPQLNVSLLQNQPTPNVLMNQ
jgi:hypothetical protein